MAEIQTLKCKFGRKFFQLSDTRGALCPFIGGVYVPTSLWQQEDLLASHSDEIEIAGAGMAPGSIADLQADQQATAVLMLDAGANISESENGKLNPTTSATLNAITAGITPTAQTAKATVPVIKASTSAVVTKK